ncbi:microtubule-associated protein Jupiter isoform X2 [Sitodiplosis mosellana]|uniref:microtubule-associated protein Jupiter isoform X2 n=1 Tax=Sitodiplosis mosellana TaxID=263140 RepID=UPI0024445CAE|nr:microtubule-associated protein Jupiter isoform X2 [Sitodiplosis mosellana]
MTSTSINVGLSNESRNSSKVLKPPGGGSSDGGIFGGSLPSTPRSVRNNMTSNIFGPANDVKNGNGNADRQGSYRYFFIDSAVKRPAANSHNRLFGDVERVPPTPKGYHKSNIPIGKDDIDAAKVTNGNGALNGNGVAANTNGNGVAHENGNAKVIGTNGHANGSRAGSDLSLDSPKPRKIPQPRELQQNGFKLATPIKRNGLIGNGYADAPLTNLSSSSTSSMFTNNSSVSISSEKTDSSATAALTRSPRFQPSSPRNPVTGLGCQAADLYCGRRRIARDGNPITGEGYKRVAAEINTTIPALNGAKQEIYKNRIPPGGFSSGLW